MGMEYVRKTYGVPAKRGMVVRPKVGPAKGFIGAIRSVDANGRLVVKEKPRNGGWMAYSIRTTSNTCRRLTPELSCGEAVNSDDELGRLRGNDCEEIETATTSIWSDS